MRPLTTHLTKNVQINAVDDPGQGGACHEYRVDILNSPGVQPGITSETSSFPLSFQNGPIKEFGVNGIPDEALYAILIDRLQGFQKGPYGCRENAVALTHLETALMWAQKRTHEREARGVEGTSAQ
jgi:hypothetical protein